MSREYRVVIERDEEGYFVASVSSLPWCHTQAKSLDVLIDRVREAIAVCQEVADDDRGGPDCRVGDPIAGDDRRTSD